MYGIEAIDIIRNELVVSLADNVILKESSILNAVGAELSEQSVSFVIKTDLFGVPNEHVVLWEFNAPDICGRVLNGGELLNEPVVPMAGLAFLEHVVLEHVLRSEVPRVGVAPYGLLDGDVDELLPVYLSRGDEGGQVGVQVAYLQVDVAFQQPGRHHLELLRLARHFRESKAV